MIRKLIADVDTTTPVVVFQADGYCSLGIVRTLGRMGVRVFCISHDPDDLAMKSRYCAGRFNWDFDASRPDDSAQFLVDVARKIGQKAILLPTFDTRSLFVDQDRDLLSSWFLLPQPNPGAVSRVYSKRLMYELCKSEGVPTPETVFPDSVEQAIKDGMRLQFPLVIKAIDADRLMHRTGHRMAVVQHPSELRDVYQALDEPGTSNLALQEYIPTDGQDAWVLGAYFDTRGDCRFVITGKKLRQLPLGGGVTTLGICAPCDSMGNSIRRIARAAGYRGIIDACFLYDTRDCLWKLLDVNPRPGANFRLFVDKSGIDVVRALYLDLTGQKVPAIEPIWGRRWLVEDYDFEAVRAHARAGSLTPRAWLNSLLGASELAYFAVDDLRPSLGFALTFSGRRLRGAARRLQRSIKPSSS